MDKMSDLQRAAWCRRVAGELKEMRLEIRMLPSEHQKMFDTAETLIATAREYEDLVLNSAEMPD